MKKHSHMHYGWNFVTLLKLWLPVLVQLHDAHLYAVQWQMRQQLAASKTDKEHDLKFEFKHENEGV